MTIHPILLCGGAGSRLWPLSRTSYPKQFVRIFGDESLFQSAARTYTGEGFARPIVVASNPYRFIAKDQLEETGIAPAAILIEPESRDTAAAILAATLWCAEQEDDPLMLAIPSDHRIDDPRALRGAVLEALGRLEPYGDDAGNGDVAHLEDAMGYGITLQQTATIPLPDSDFADAMTADGIVPAPEILLFRASTLRSAFETLAPDLLAAVSEAVRSATNDIGFVRLAAEPWSALPQLSMEHLAARCIDVAPVTPKARDSGSLDDWTDVMRLSDVDAQGNACSPGATAIGCCDTLLRSESAGIEVVGIGLKDIVAVATGDAVLVASRSEIHKLGEALTALRARRARQADELPVDHRPWGWFESLAMGSRFQVKRIVVKPGAALSLQSHHHRSEHWIVVSGTALVTIGEEVRLVTENQSVYIPLGAVHRMENPGKVPMVLIEVQTGAYLGEDDIIRYEDVYARGQA